MGAAVDDKPPLHRGGRQTRQKSADALKQLLLWKEGGRHCSLSCLFRLPSSAKAVFVLGCFVYLSTCCKPILCTDAPEASSVRQNFSTIETTENVEQHAVSEINSSQNSEGPSAGLAEAEGRNRSQGTEGERSVPSNRAGREILLDRHAAFPKAIRVGERFGELEFSQPGKSRVVQESASSSRSVSVVQHSPFRDTGNSDDHCDASIDEDKILFLRQHKRGGGYVRVPVLISSRFLPAAFGLRLYKRATLGQHLKVSSEKATALFNTTTSNTSSDDSSHSSALPPSSNLLSAAPASSDETPAASTEGNDTFNALPVFFPPSVVEEATRPLGIAVRPPVVAIPAGATDFEVQIQLQRKPRGQTVTVQIDCYALSPVKPVLSSQEKELTGQDAFSSDGPSDGRYPDGSSGTGVGNSKNEAQEAVMTANIGTGDSKPASASQKGLILSAREEIKRQAWKQRHWRTIHVKEATNARCRVSARSSDPDEEVVVKRGTFIELLSLTKALPVHSETVKGDKRNSRPAGAATDDNNFPPPPTQPSLSGGERPWWSLSREYPVNVYVPPQNRKQ